MNKNLMKRNSSFYEDEKLKPITNILEHIQLPKMNQVFQRSTISSNSNSARRNSTNSNVSFSSSTSTYSATPVTQHPAPTASLKPERPQRSRVVIPSSSSSFSPYPTGP
jgi:hypothetical protein